MLSCAVNHLMTPEIYLARTGTTNIACILTLILFGVLETPRLFDGLKNITL